MKKDMPKTKTYLNGEIIEVHFASGTDVFLAVAPLCKRVSIHGNACIKRA
jgi:hypothetical protein